MNELSAFLDQPDVAAEAAIWIAIRLTLSGILGAFIAVLHRRSRTGSARNPGLRPTLVLLAMLITLVTIAVGTNVAVAFTLVGTLAIVRFRTTVSDVRDTAFVIFSVAVGIAAGQNVVTAVVGILCIGIAVEILHRVGSLRESVDPGPDSSPDPEGVGPTVGGSLRLGIVPPNSDASLYRPTLERFGIEARIVRSRIERDQSCLILTFDLLGAIVRDRVPELTTTLLERPEITEATIAIEG